MTIAVLVVALFFLGMGVWAIAIPDRVLSFFGVAVTTTDGRNEVRAVYGGYGVAMSVLLLLALRDPNLRLGVFACVAAAMVGMAGGRLASAVLDRPPGFYPWLFMATELAIAATLLFALQAPAG